jgi:hypothetical protein
MVVLASAAVAASVVVLAGIAGASPGTDPDVGTSIGVPDVYEGLVEVTESGWIEFKLGQEYALENPTAYTMQGESAPDGSCVFSGELVLAPGSRAVEERETAINPSTCQMRLERGTPPADAIAGEADGATSPQGTAKDGEGQSSPESATGGSGGEVSIAAAARRSAGFHRTWWEDPANFDVNSVRNSTDWHWNGSDVVGPVYGGYRYWWLTESGWELRGNDWNNFYTSYQTTSSSYAHFRNGYFCTAAYGQYQPPTHTYYDRNAVHGRYNGDLVGTWRSWTDGGCESFLHRRNQLVRTLN